MRFLVDNALSPVVADRLREAGYSAEHVRAVGLAESSDDVIFEKALEDDQVIISADTDFGLLLTVRNATRPSVILLRRTSQRRPEVQAKLLLANLPVIEDDLAKGSIVVFGEQRIRVRRLPVRPVRAS